MAEWRAKQGTGVRIAVSPEEGSDCATLFAIELPSFKRKGILGIFLLQMESSAFCLCCPGCLG